MRCNDFQNRWMCVASAAVLALSIASQAFADLLVSSRMTNRVAHFDELTGASLGDFTSGFELEQPRGITFGPDGNFYAVGTNPNQILRFNGMTGEFMDVFVPANSGGMARPGALLFGPDGNLYVADEQRWAVYRFNGQTGAFIDMFVLQGDGGLVSPRDMAFGPDGNLYVLSRSNTHSVIRYSGQTGRRIGTFIYTGYGGLHRSDGLAFGPDGNLYVSSSLTRKIIVFHGTTGSYIRTFTEALNSPTSLRFGRDGSLYVVEQNLNAIVRVNGYSGVSDGVFASGDLDEPRYLILTPSHGDVNGDGCVNDADLLRVLFDFGRISTGLTTDMNNDSVVNDSDLLIVLFNFGRGC